MATEPLTFEQRKSASEAADRLVECIRQTAKSWHDEGQKPAFESDVPEPTMLDKSLTFRTELPGISSQSAQREQFLEAVYHFTAERLGLKMDYWHVPKKEGMQLIVRDIALHDDRPDNLSFRISYSELEEVAGIQRYVETGRNPEERTEIGVMRATEQVQRAGVIGQLRRGASPEEGVAQAIIPNGYRHSTARESSLAHIRQAVARDLKIDAQHVRAEFALDPETFRQQIAVQVPAAMISRGPATAL